MFRYKDYSLLCNNKWRIIVEHLSDKGIYLFNISSDFYHQRYFGFNYNGNDITTGDRQSDVYTSVSVCESSCTYRTFNESSKRVKSSCFVENEIYIENNTEEVKEEATNFLDSLNDQIDYKLVVCYKVFKNFLKRFYLNLGFWFFFICFVLFIIEEIIFCCSSVHKLLSKTHKNFQKPIKKTCEFYFKSTF